MSEEKVSKVIELLKQAEGLLLGMITEDDEFLDEIQCDISEMIGELEQID